MLMATLTETHITIKDEPDAMESRRALTKLSCTPSQLHANISLRIWPLKMIMERQGNHKEVQEWLSEKLGWRIIYSSVIQMDIEKELRNIRSYEQKTHGPTRMVNDSEIVFSPT